MGRRKPPSGRRPDFPHGSVYIMTLVRSTVGINKAEDTGRMDAQIGFADASRRIFPTALASFSNFVAGFVRRPCVTEVQ